MTNDEELELRQLLWITHQRKKCEAKQKFFSKEAATMHRCHGSARTPPKLYPYHCDWCGWWHNTSNKPRATDVSAERQAA